MTDIRYEGSRAYFRFDNQFCSMFFELSMQPSGAVLVELRRFGASGNRSFYSAYATKILRQGSIDDTMYGCRNFYALTADEMHAIDQAVRGLRDRNEFDETLAAGATIQEMYH